MPCRFLQQRMTFRDLEWPFHASRARMSKIKNGGLDQYGAGPFEQ